MSEKEAAIRIEEESTASSQKGYPPMCSFWLPIWEPGERARNKLATFWEGRL